MYFLISIVTRFTMLTSGRKIIALGMKMVRNHVLPRGWPNKEIEVYILGYAIFKHSDW